MIHYIDNNVTMLVHCDKGVMYDIFIMRKLGMGYVETTYTIFSRLF